MQVAEKVFYSRETEEEKEERKQKELEMREKERDKRQDKKLTKILATVVQESRTERERVPGNRKGPLSKDQCAYCKETGHWRRDCPKRKKKQLNSRATGTRVLTLNNDSD